MNFVPEFAPANMLFDAFFCFAGSGVYKEKTLQTNVLQDFSSNDLFGLAVRRGVQWYYCNRQIIKRLQTRFRILGHTLVILF